MLAQEKSDPELDFNRRTELLETRSGHIFTRTCGDAAMPLILYVHTNGREQTSAAWNGVVSAFAHAKRESTKLLLEEKAGASADAAGGGGAALSPGPLMTGGSSCRCLNSPLLTSASRVPLSSAARGFQLLASPAMLTGTHRSSHLPSSRYSSRALSTRRSGRSSSRSSSGGGGGGLLTAAAAGGDDDDERERDENEDAYDDRLVKLRGKLSAVLQRRQTELAQTTCSLCANLLLLPRRNVRCRHVLCALCVERSILYQNECPVCAAPSGAPPIDREHDEIMRMRLHATGTALPKMVSAWLGRLEEAEAERRANMRVLLEFGSILSSAEPTTKVTLFLGLIRQETSPGSYRHVHRGSNCTLPAPSRVIERVTFDTNPTDKSEEKVIDVVAAPNGVKEAREGYTLVKGLPRGRTLPLRDPRAASRGQSRAAAVAACGPVRSLSDALRFARRLRRDDRRRRALGVGIGARAAHDPP